MSTKTKAGMIGTLILAGVVVAGATLMNGSFKSKNPFQDPHRKRQVAFLGVWQPSPRLPDGAHITIWLGGKLMHDGTVPPAASFAKSYPGNKGDRAEIIVKLLKGPAESTVGCAIAAILDDASIGLDRQQVKGAATGSEVRCWATVP